MAEPHAADAVAPRSFASLIPNREKSDYELDDFSESRGSMDLAARRSFDESERMSLDASRPSYDYARPSYDVERISYDDGSRVDAGQGDMHLPSTSAVAQKLYVTLCDRPPTACLCLQNMIEN